MDGRDGVSGYEIVQGTCTTFDASIGEILGPCQVFCPAGKVPTGGGGIGGVAQIGTGVGVFEDAALHSSTPILAGPAGWEVFIRVINDTQEGLVSAIVYAVCAFAN